MELKKMINCSFQNNQAIGLVYTKNSAQNEKRYFFTSANFLRSTNQIKLKPTVRLTHSSLNSSSRV